MDQCLCSPVYLLFAMDKLAAHNQFSSFLQFQPIPELCLNDSKVWITRSVAAELAGHDMRFCPIVHTSELTVPDLRTHNHHNVGLVLVVTD